MVARHAITPSNRQQLWTVCAHTLLSPPAGRVQVPTSTHHLCSVLAQRRYHEPGQQLLLLRRGDGQAEHIVHGSYLVVVLHNQVGSARAQRSRPPSWVEVCQEWVSTAGQQLEMPKHSHVHVDGCGVRHNPLCRCTPGGRRDSRRHALRLHLQQRVGLRWYS
jgi:hypothetical protein